ncbi:MAG: bifunctional hydroxymethylpyrimidine kinase/phosphomethylpyrimidine kinase, partial [Planctomycetota bacterium]
QVHGCSALTCLTAQNTTGVFRVDPIQPEAVVAQLRAVYTDLPPTSAKTGMLFHQPVIEVVSDFFSSHKIGNLVVDPVMMSRSGDSLLDKDSQIAIEQQMIPLATILTPNRFEAAHLAKRKLDSLNDMKDAAKALFQLGPAAVLVKGGAMPDKCRGTDVYFDGSQVEILSTESISTRNTNGTGCTLSAAIAANLAKGLDLFDACTAAKKYVTDALQNALQVGQGNGPVCHFFPIKDIK